jgi:aspartate 1-decarboxylase
MNGAAAHLIGKGHKVIIISFAGYEETEARRHRPRTVFVDDGNRPA